MQMQMMHGLAAIRLRVHHHAITAIGDPGIASQLTGKPQQSAQHGIIASVIEGADVLGWNDPTCSLQFGLIGASAGRGSV